MFKSERAGIGGFLYLLVVMAIALTVVAYTFGDLVNPGEIGIRQITFGPAKGFRREVLDPGYHWSIPFYSRIRKIPQNIQIYHIHRDGEQGQINRNISAQRVRTDLKDKKANSPQSSMMLAEEAAFSVPSGPKPLEIQTSDGSSVLADLSILARFYTREGEENGIKHGGATDLIQELGPNYADWQRTILRVTTDEVRKALAKLATSEFYNPTKREAQIAEGKLAINKRLAQYGVKIEDVLLRRYTYEERIDNAIFQKNIQDQEERLSAAKSKFAEAQAQLEQVAAEWDAKVRTLTVEGENKAKIARSEGDLYEAEQTAQGDLLVAKAKAEVDRSMAQTLATTAGADVYVARRMAPVLGSLKGGVVGNVDPYNLEEWARKMGSAR